MAARVVASPSVAMHSAKRFVLASSVRPSRLPFESDWLQVVRKLVWVVPFVFGGAEESRVVKIQAFRHAVESQDYPLVSQYQTNVRCWVSDWFEPLQSRL